MPTRLSVFDHDALHSHYLDNKREAMAAVKLNGQFIIHVSLRLRDDCHVVLAAVRRNGSALKFVSARLRNNRGVVLEAVRRSDPIGSTLRFASKRLQNDRGVVSEAVRCNASALRFAPEHLQDDHGIVLEAVRRKGSTLQFASERLRDDSDVVLEAVRQCRYALRFASPRLKCNTNVIIAALGARDWKSSQWRNEDSILNWLHDGFWGDEVLAMRAVLADPKCIRYVPLSHPKVNVDVIKVAVFLDPENLGHINLGDLFGWGREALREVFLGAVTKNGLALRYTHHEEIFASAQLHCDRELVGAAINQNGLSLKYASRGLQKDRSLVLAAVEQAGSAAARYARFPLRGDPGVLFMGRLGDLGCKNMLAVEGGVGEPGPTCPLSLWPHILAKANDDPWCIYHYLKNRHELFDLRCS